MEPSLFELVMHGGVPALSLVLLYLLARHHIRTLKQHKRDEREWMQKVSDLEEAYRTKVEELLTGQIAWVEKISEALSESTHTIQALRDDLDEKR